MDVVTGVELECSYGAGDGQTRSRVASMPKERSGGPRLDQSCDWEKYGYGTLPEGLYFGRFYNCRYCSTLLKAMHSPLCPSRQVARRPCTHHHAPPSRQSCPCQSPSPRRPVFWSVLQL